MTKYPQFSHYFFTNTQKPEGSEDSQSEEGLECDKVLIDDKLGSNSEDLVLGSCKLTPLSTFQICPPIATPGFHHLPPNLLPWCSLYHHLLSPY